MLIQIKKKAIRSDGFFLGEIEYYKVIRKVLVGFAKWKNSIDFYQVWSMIKFIII